MKLLLTGAYGNIGKSSLESLLRKGHEVRCFDVPTKKNLEAARRYAVNTVWGDIRNREHVKKAVQGVDAVVHLAAMIPPLSERNPQLAYEINVIGTKNIISSLGPKQKLIFASSISLLGPSDSSLKKADDEIMPSDNYSHHKVICEWAIKKSKINWIILRFGVVPPLDLGKLDPVMFTIPLDTNIEFLHTADAGLAVANAVENKANKKVLMIGGGKSCQISYREYLGRLLRAIGIGMLPEKSFGKKKYYTNWMDTSESQELLKYQNHSFDDFVSETRHRFRNKRPFVKLLRPIIKQYMLLGSKTAKHNIFIEPQP